MPPRLVLFRARIAATLARLCNVGGADAEHPSRRSLAPTIPSQPPPPAGIVGVAVGAAARQMMSSSS
jgi:hypothetical protein